MAAAERAAAEVLEEARALSGGLRQLGRSLEEQADRILRDVQAAHRRMQADLRVGPRIGRRRSPAPTGGGARAPRAARAGAPRVARARRVRRGGRRNPFDDLDVPGTDASSDRPRLARATSRVAVALNAATVRDAGREPQPGGRAGP